MDDARAMRRVERARDLNRDPQRLLERQRAFRQSIGERLAFDQFQDQRVDAAVALFSQRSPAHPDVPEASSVRRTIRAAVNGEFQISSIME